MPVIPLFEPDGLLPPSDYEASFDELRQSILVRGPDGAARSPTWDSAWRAKLVANLEILTNQLWQVGITEVFADGSFAEDKDHPNDIDAYFVCGLDELRTGELTRQLNPHVPGLGIGCGIFDPHGHELEFPSAFRQSRRDGKPRGIVRIRFGSQA